MKSIVLRSRVLLTGIGIFGSVMLVGCQGDGGGSGTIVNPTPVQAQSGYSSASLSGTYTITMLAGSNGAFSSPIPFMGTLVLDGNGNITSGNIIEAASTYGSSAVPGTTTTCPITATGTYTLGNNATGSASLTLSGAIVSANATNNTVVDGCLPVPPQLSFSIGAAQQGQVFVFQPTAGSTMISLSGSASKQ